MRHRYGYGLVRHQHGLDHRPTLIAGHRFYNRGEVGPSVGKQIAYAGLAQTDQDRVRRGAIARRRTGIDFHIHATLTCNEYRH